MNHLDLSKSGSEEQAASERKTEQTVNKQVEIFNSNIKNISAAIDAVAQDMTNGFVQTITDLENRLVITEEAYNNKSKELYKAHTYIDNLQAEIMKLKEAVIAERNYAKKPNNEPVFEINQSHEDFKRDTEHERNKKEAAEDQKRVYEKVKTAHEMSQAFRKDYVCPICKRMTTGDEIHGPALVDVEGKYYKCPFTGKKFSEMDKEEVKRIAYEFFTSVDVNKGSYKEETEKKMKETPVQSYTREDFVKDLQKIESIVKNAGPFDLRNFIQSL